MHHAVIGPPQLEGKNRLQILALQKHLVIEFFRQVHGVVERRFLRDVVDAGFQDSTKIFLSEHKFFQFAEMWRKVYRKFNQSWNVYTFIRFTTSG